MHAYTEQFYNSSIWYYIIQINISYTSAEHKRFIVSLNIGLYSSLCVHTSTQLLAAPQLAQQRRKTCHFTKAESSVFKLVIVSNHHEHNNLSLPESYLGTIVYHIKQNTRDTRETKCLLISINSDTHLYIARFFSSTNTILLHFY